jgi:hypothetical protein
VVPSKLFQSAVLRTSVPPVRTGATRTAVDYAWPPFTKPAPPAPIAYLDLNHWISLAKAAVGHPDGGKSQPALDALRELRASGQVLLPLSATHYMEMSRIRSARQRFDVADVMEELSGFECLMDRTVVIRLELQEAFCRLLGEDARIYDPLPLIGNGGMQAFGLRGGLRIRDGDGQDVTDDAKSRWPAGPEAFDVWRRDAEHRLNRSLLAGPSAEEEPALRKAGWNPEKATEVSKQRAQQENEQATRLAEDSRWRRGRLRDVVAARYLALEIHPTLDEESTQRGIDFPDLFPQPDAARRFTDSMPSADVWITLLTAQHRNPQTRWTANDIYDADALSVAIPYCDFVATERHAAHLLHAEGLPERVDTTVVTSLDELVAALAALNAP